MWRTTRLLVLPALVAGTLVSCSPFGDAGCPVDDDVAPTVATEWVELTLDAIRADLPAPTVHARNLYHLSAAMWDAWAAYEPTMGALFHDARPDAAGDGDAVAQRQTAAVVAAAHTVVVDRYDRAVRSADALLDRHCGDDVSGAGVVTGVAAATAVLEATVDDGWDADPATDGPVNDPMRVDGRGTVLADPDRWQPLEFDQMVTQNGIPLDQTVQTFIGQNWGGVTTWAIDTDDPALDVPPPPSVTDPATRAVFHAGMLDVLRASSQLDPADGVEVDRSPAAVGDAPLGTADGDGHDVNPATGVGFPPNTLPRADHLRVIAEHWADGPTSETPPGHWNTIALTATEALGPDGWRVAGEGEPVDRLTWDVTLLLGLNGALHDAAIAAWGTKAEFDTVRPVSAIRWAAGNGQSSDPGGPAYDPMGLPLEDGLVEVVTAASATAQHADLVRREGREVIGQVAVHAWAARDDDDEQDLPPVRWILGEDWLPYQMATFVTPAFAGYVSGHSTFSRAAAELLTAITGDPSFPGGFGQTIVPRGELGFDEDPTDDVTLQWATYRDAADEAGRSRIAGGIHPPWDDLAGRVLGAEVGQQSWQRLQELRTR